MGILFALLVCAVIFVAIITIDWLLGAINEQMTEGATTVALGTVKEILTRYIEQEAEKKNAIPLEQLKARAGKKGTYTARVENGVVLKESVKLYKSDKMDQETEDLMRENNGMLLVSR